MPTAPMTINQRKRANGQATKAPPDRRESAAKRGYGRQWRKARKAHLMMHPLCHQCITMEPKRYTPATVVDHIQPHGGDMELFWASDNWCSLCAHCHSRKTAAEDGAFGNRRIG